MSSVASIIPSRNRGTMRQIFRLGVPRYYQTLCDIRGFTNEEFKDAEAFRQAHVEKVAEKARNNFRANPERRQAAEKRRQAPKALEDAPAEAPAAEASAADAPAADAPAADAPAADAPAADAPAAEAPAEAPPLLHSTMADIANLRKMGLHDLLVPLHDDPNERKVVLYIKMNAYTSYRKIVKPLMHVLRHYKASFRFCGEKRDSDYVCVEGVLTKVPDGPFHKFVNEQSFCEQVFVSKTLSQKFAVDIVIPNRRVSLECELVDMFVDRQIMLYRDHSRNPVESFCTIFRDVAQGRGQRNKITACLLDEYSPDSLQVYEILYTWSSRKVSDFVKSTYQGNVRRKRKAKEAEGSLEIGN